MSSVKYLRPVRPLHFPCSEPEDEKVPQGRRHHHLCNALYQIIRAAIPIESGTLGADQYVYFQANNPKRCLAPDVFVKAGVPDGEDFDSWMCWERGAPDVAFEVLSPSDSYERWTLRQKLARYAEVGVKELYVFNVDAKEGTRLRAWDRKSGDFVERLVKKERTRSAILGVELYLDAVYAEGKTYPCCLRARRIVDGTTIVFPTADERARTAEEKARAAKAAARAAAASQREAEASQREAEARVAALEAELARLREGGRS
ncbi:MAG: Uma2 family endonuclease [Labilithrix sp.]|nr:Uma2 family endonuclease [Labilithrix sp.]MCW5812880.1 Uma2 family endonuclease [Labilithrix sp.]